MKACDAMGTKKKGRKDHYVPQGYLRGFIAPERTKYERPLWHLDLRSYEWSEKSTAEVGWECGFYDYAGDGAGLEHPDVTFAVYEREYPIVRERILFRSCRRWRKELPFLLRFMQMMRARSPLFFKQQEAQNRTLRGATITGVGPGNRITVDSLELRPLPEHVIRNGIISQMGQEIRKGPDWMQTFNWCLRYTQSPKDAFVTGPQPLMVTGPAGDLVTALKHPETLVFFPICWQACLIGSLRRFDVGTDPAHPSLLSDIRRLYQQPENGYLISPDVFTPYPAAALGGYRLVPQ